MSHVQRSDHHFNSSEVYTMNSETDISKPFDYSSNFRNYVGRKFRHRTSGRVYYIQGIHVVADTLNRCFSCCPLQHPLISYLYPVEEVLNDAFFEPIESED